MQSYSVLIETATFRGTQVQAACPHLASAWYESEGVKDL